MAGAKTKTVRFLQSPTGAPYMLAYSAGQIAELPVPLADQLIKEGLAEEHAVSASTQSTTASGKTVEKATSKKPKTSTKR